MHDSSQRLSDSKSMGQMPYVRYIPQEPPSSTTLLRVADRTRERVSISNLINGVDNTRITSPPSSPGPMSSPPPNSTQRLSSSQQTRTDDSRDSSRQRHRTSSTRIRATSAQGNRTQTQILDDRAARRKKLQSEKKRLWRKNLSPDQKAKRQELDAQRKREQRMNMTPDQRAEARRKDAARKAAKRKQQKEQLRSGSSTSDLSVVKHSYPSSTSSSSPPPNTQQQQQTTSPTLPGHSSMYDILATKPSFPVEFDSAILSRNKIQDLLN